MHRWQLALDSLWPLARAALTGTIPLTLISFAIGLVIAVLIALAKLSSIKPVSLFGAFYVSLIRGTPLLVQIFIIFYVFPFIGITMDAWTCGIIALSVNVGGYAAETIRGAILAVPKGQWEASATINLSYWTTLRRIILPQAFKIAIPPLSNTFISLVKDSSLVSTIGVLELLRKAQIIATPTYDFLTLYIEAALIYWAICIVLSFGQRRLENYFDGHATV
ncbi:MAG: amino acid ABC transporter permease [Propionibacteriaceae bacterium]|jgi:cystine transport system permease protein|nr:amino acid ABC transporter permease [Propionibacteriaceae bacterium]